ncbi:hypothetical protein BDV30DRAFT_234925 [Aspergillus minisclerotigenes]|uniref:Uncharacterized protein n=1 Tax=Aspergillus minisclerotigenes TaxID=656917 RepID=A0A5N6JGU4_9EURO|nr:hypothetical protein BDV30DRAFT_234925 [Aspergillus minisclerotigenes]
MPILRHLLAYSHPRLRHEALLTRLHLRPPGRIPVGYHHTQATNLQAKPNAAGHDPAPMPERPVTRLFRWVSDSQTRRPWITQLCLTPLIYCLGDFSAQMIGDEDYDYHRSLRSFVIGLVIAIPSHEWFLFLGRRFNYSSPSLSLGAKVAAYQIFHIPMFNVYFLHFMGSSSGRGFGVQSKESKTRSLEVIPEAFFIGLW